MGRFSRDKGARWEREVVRRMCEHIGLDAKRGFQSRGGSVEAPDVDAPPFWIETKVGARPPIVKALEQAELGAAHRWPLAVIKQDRCRPFVVMYLDDFEDLVSEWLQRGEA